MTSPALESFTSAFAAQAPSQAQRDAFAEFARIGLPTTKVDSWKYTDLRRLSLKNFRTSRTQPTGSELSERVIALEDSTRVDFINGQLLAIPSSPSPSIAITKVGVERASTSEHDAHSREAPAASFTLLNTALAHDALAIRIRAQEGAPTTIYIVHRWTDDAKDYMSHPHVRIHLESRANCVVVEHFIGRESGANLGNSQTHIDIAQNATCEHVRIVDDGTNFNIGRVECRVGRGAIYRSHNFLFGGSLVRSEFDVFLEGAHAEAHLNGVTFASGTQHFDVRTCLHHNVPDTHSHEDYRGIADQRGRVIFNGKVIVAKDAQRTDAAQSSRNLLLSKQAEIDTRPELEIYANDVKCAHGATVGQLDATSLFYLRSRGLSEQEARTLLVHAFAGEVIDRISHAAVRAHLLQRFMARMEAQA